MSNDAAIAVNLRDDQAMALRLVDNGKRMRLTDRGNLIVSRAAKGLKILGLIREAPERWIGYEPTLLGRSVLRARRCDPLE